MISLPQPGLYLGIAFGIMLVATWLMGRQGKFFFTKDPIRRQFSILEMEFPAKSFDLENIINGIYQLPDDAPKTIRALKAQLLLDYLLFIPAVYGGVFVLCMHLAGSLHTDMGRYWFTGLAWAQALAFILDYIENTYFWIMIGKRDIPVPRPAPFEPEKTSRSFKAMQLLEIVKWGLPLLAMACCLSVLAYFWLSGKM